MRHHEIKEHIDNILKLDRPLDRAEELITIIASESAIAAKLFSQYEDTDGNPPGIEWLPLFEEAGLLNAYEIAAANRTNLGAQKDALYRVPLVGYRLYSTDLLTEKAGHLCGWLTQHLDKVEFIDWLLTKGGIIHPHFRDMITWQLWSGGKRFGGKGQPTPFGSILHVLTNHDLMRHGFQDVDYYLLERTLGNDRQGISPVLKQKLISALSPRLAATGTSYSSAKNLRKTLQNNDIDILAEHLMRSLFKLETAQDYHLKKLVEHIYKKRGSLSDIAPDAYALLKRTFDLLLLIGEGRFTYISRPSIKPHEQNRGYSVWETLVDLVRDSLESLLKDNPTKGKALLELMLEQGTSGGVDVDDPEAETYPIFMRIALHALSQKPAGMTAKELLELAWRYKDSWLFTSEGKKEGHDLLQAVWSDDSVPLSLRKRVIASILRGPKDVRGSRKKDDLQYKHYQIFIRLKWLKEVGGELTDRGNVEHQKLAELFRGKQDSPLDVLSSYSESRTGQDAPDYLISEDAFSNASIDEHIDWLSDNDASETTWKAKNNVSGLWLKLFNSNESKALKLLEDVGDVGCWSSSAWGPLCYEITKSADKQHEWTTFFHLLARIPEGYLENFLYEATWALRYFGESSKGRDGFDREDFLRAWEHVLPVAKRYHKSEVKASIGAAINHPLGHLSEALLGFMRYQANGKRGDVSRSFSPEFDTLLEGDFETLAYPKVLFCRSLFAMYVLLPEWTEVNIIPLLDWEAKDSEAEPYWSAFLSNARLSEALISCIKGYMLDIFRDDRIEVFADSTIRSNLMRLVGIMLLEGDLLEEEVQLILAASKDRDRTSILSLFLDRLDNDDTREQEKEWAVISDWLLKYQEYSYSSKASYRLAKMLLSLDEAAFQAAYKKIGHLLSHIDRDLFMILNELVDDDRSTKSNHYLWNHPELLLSFLAKVTPSLSTNYSFAVDYLKVILRELKDFESTEDYLKLQDAFLAAM
jgi:hypothetical protein